MSHYVITEEHIDSLVLHPDNANLGSVDEIRESIREYGWIGVVVGQTSTGYVLVGENRLAAAKAEGIEIVPVLWLDIDDEKALKYLVASNITRQLSTTDDVKLLAVLDSIDSLQGTGFTQADYDLLKDALQSPTARGGNNDDDGFMDDDRGGGSTNNTSVVCSVGPYQFTVDAETYQEFYDFFMESYDIASATQEVAVRLGFDPC